MVNLFVSTNIYYVDLLEENNKSIRYILQAQLFRGKQLVAMINEDKLFRCNIKIIWFSRQFKIDLIEYLAIHPELESLTRLDESWERMCYPEGRLPIDLNSYVSMLIDQSLVYSWAKEKCTYSTLYRLDTDPLFEWRQIQAIYDINIKRELLLKYGDHKVDILNDRLGFLP